MTKHKTIIFDFDGTIADSLPVVLDIYKELLPGKKKITHEEIHKLRRMPLQKITAELGISMWKLPFLLRRGRKLMKARIHTLEIFPDIAKVIKKLHTDGYALYLVSSNSTENVQMFLREKQLLQYFIEARGFPGLHKKEKALKKLTKRHKLDLNHAYYVGDEVRDMVAAKRASMHTVAVTWGFNDEELLQETGPDMLVRKPKELLKKFK